MLSKYRVLDLADDRGIFSGRILGDMGADVIKVEPLWGDPARRIGPFYHDETDIESSLFWQLYATNKRSVTLDIGAAAARDALLKLVASSDFLIESFRPGYLEGLGLGYESLRTLNPRLIYVSITPFGQFGPYRDYSATDITGIFRSRNITSPFPARIISSASCPSLAKCNSTSQPSGMARAICFLAKAESSQISTLVLLITHLKWPPAL